MSNFTVKPATLLPSTYSQMGRVLIPSKDCDNRKIARKFTEKGAKIKIDSFSGKILSSSFISTFKRFDRPSPLISTECQPCKTVSVPSVTDKTIYPCSVGKYSVTGYNDSENKIGVMGNSMFPRITTSDYQLYQQYRVTEKNIINDCCPFTLDNGVYVSSSDDVPFLPVFYENCEFCINVYENLLIDVRIEKIDSCTFRFISVEGEIILKIIGNNKISGEFIEPKNPSFILEKPDSQPLDFSLVSVNKTDFTFESGCGDILVTDIESTPISVSWREDGKLVNFFEGVVLPGGETIILNNGDDFYSIVLEGSDYRILDKINCECQWRSGCPCSFDFQSGVYTPTGTAILGFDLIGVVYKNCQLCIVPNIGTTDGDEPIILEPIGICKWKGTDEDGGVGDIEIIGDDKIKITISDGTSYEYELNQTTAFNTIPSINFVSFTAAWLNGTCPTTVVTVSWDNSTLTINDDSINIETQSGIYIDDNKIYIFDGDQTFFVFGKNTDGDYGLVFKFNCICYSNFLE